jgi:predicted RecA/RadA family phage recombinase
MKNFKQKGETLTLTAPADVLSGAGVLVGSIFGVASGDALSGADVQVATQGVFNLAKDGSSFTVGARCYWDNSAKALTSTASSNKLVGVAMAVAATGDATVDALLTAAFTL